MKLLNLENRTIGWLMIFYVKFYMIFYVKFYVKFDLVLSHNGLANKMVF